MSAVAVKVVQGASQAAVLLEPLRLRMLDHLSEADSATGLAKKLKLPRQKVNYHLRELEKAGLVEPVEERRKGNCVERIVRATATSYLISPEVLGPLASDPSRVADRLSSAYQVAVAAKTIRDLAILQRRADKAGKKLATFTLQTDVRFADATARNAFTEELSNTIVNLIAKYHDEKSPSGRLFKFNVGAYPAITKDEQGNEIGPDSKGRAT